MAMQMPLWIHAAGTIEGRKAEFWFSQKNRISAMCNMPNSVMFIDHRARTKDWYDLNSQRIVREHEPEYFQASFIDFEKIFESLFHGNAPTAALFVPDSEIVTSSTSQITVSGRQIVEYNQTFRIRHGDTGGQMVTHKVITHVDPIDNIPIQMTTESTYKDDKNKEITTTIVWEFNYPDDGPADIYALGVPASAQRIDGMASPELSRVIETAREARANFGPYEAVVFDEHAMSHFFHVWRKGTRFRVEMALLAPGNSSPVLPDTPSTNLDLFRKYFSKYRHGPVTVCDGKIVYETEQRGSYNAEAGREYEWVERRRVKRLGDGISVAGEGTARGNFVELYAYPTSLQYPLEGVLKVEIKPLRSDDPPGMILIENKISIPKEKDYAVRLLLDPARGFITVRHETEFDEHKSEVLLMEDFEKSPAGIWYPTKVHRNIYSSSDLKNLEDTQTFFFSLEFPKDLSDDLFHPVSHDAIRKVLSE